MVFPTSCYFKCKKLVSILFLTNLLKGKCFILKFKKAGQSKIEKKDGKLIVKPRFKIKTQS